MADTVDHSLCSSSTHSSSLRSKLWHCSVVGRLHTLEKAGPFPTPREDNLNLSQPIIEIPFSLPGDDLGMGMSIILNSECGRVFLILKKGYKGAFNVVKYLLKLAAVILQARGQKSTLWAKHSRRMKRPGSSVMAMSHWLNHAWNHPTSGFLCYWCQLSWSLKSYWKHTNWNTH